jgi:hypothetical protein
MVIPGVPHCVTQRGNRRQTVIFEDADYQYYKARIAQAAAKTGTDEGAAIGWKKFRSKANNQVNWQRWYDCNHRNLSPECKPLAR